MECYLLCKMDLLIKPTHLAYTYFFFLSHYETGFSKCIFCSFLCAFVFDDQQNQAHLVQCVGLTQVAATLTYH